MAPVLARHLGADRSFERLYRKHAGDVYRYALVVLRNQADAEDVTQTTFLNAYRAMEKGERPRSPQNWLIAIAHNVCRQRFRQSQRRPAEVVFEDELAETVVEDDALSAEDIRRALGHLAFNQRSALVMRELEGRSYQEIAEILSMSVSAVETLIFRARRALREQLADGITCHEAELAISRQLDGRLPRKQKGALRAHLRECAECAAFARSQRAQRGALKALGAIPLPSSLAGLFGGGGAATVGGGVAIKAALLGTGVVLATGAGYEGARHGAFHHHAIATAVAAKAHRQAARPQPPVVVAAVVRVAREQARDQQPFRGAAVTVHRTHLEHVRRALPPGLAKPRPEPEHKEVSVLPPSRERASDLKPTHVKKPKPPKQHDGGEAGSHGNGGGNATSSSNANGGGNGNSGGIGNGGGNGSGNSGEHGKSGP
jgi:RNA polymerase sigma factor (sigma-70 family)